MRSIVRRTFAPLASLALVGAFSSTAHAEGRMQLTPYAARSSARSGLALGDAQLESRAHAVLARVVPASRNVTAVATSTDRFGDGESITHFAQLHHGLPVIGRGAAVRLSASGDPILTAVDLQGDLPSSAFPGITAAVAARASAGVAIGTVTASDAHLVVWPLMGGGSRLAYVVLPQVPAGIPFAPRFVVDAQTGKILEARDLVQHANAMMYRTNPTKSPTLESLALALAPSAAAAGKLTNDFVTSANCIDRKTVKSVSFSGVPLKVHVCEIEQVATANAEGDFNYTPSDVAGALESRSDEFSEVAMYYHTTRAYAFFRGLAGTPEAQVVVDKPLRVVANLQIPAGISTGNIAAASDPNIALETFSNAFFSPAGGGLGAIFEQLYGLKGGGLWFGQGPQRDYAYDGDVVYHEFTHAVVDKTLQLAAWHVDARGAIDSPGAMNEGLADYFSSALTGDPDVGEYASKDISQNSGVIRTLANKDKCPSAVIGEVHFDSTLFSGALWEARVSLPEADRTKFDAALYKAMRTSPGNGDLGYDDLAKLFAATLATDLPAGKTALETAMTGRGVLPSCERIFESTGAPIKAAEPALGGFAAPGTQSVSFGAVAPGIIQVHGKTEGNSQFTVTFTTRKASGGTNPLGGNASPAKLVVLAKLGKPITWTATGGGTHDADKKVAGGEGTQHSAVIDVPAGTTDLYVQIGNEGESDSAYDGLTLTPTGVVTPPEPAGPTATPATTPSSSTDDGGCGCSTPGHTTDGLGGISLTAVAVLAIAAGVVRRRRRT